jgi:hypothetical protein
MSYGSEVTYPDPDELAEHLAWTRMNRAINWALDKESWERRAVSRHRVYKSPETAAGLAAQEDKTCLAWGRAFDAIHAYNEVSPTNRYDDYDRQA